VGRHAESLDRRCDLLHVEFRSRNHGDARTFVRERLRDGQSDAFRGGGDERDLALDPEVHVGNASDLRVEGMALPPEIAGHLNLDGKPVTPRPSATVLLIRDGDPWELLLVHRPGGADFAPGAYVFPGGTVHDDDREWGDEIAAAAIRELFEETGILLARRGRDFANDADCAALRSATARSTSFADERDATKLFARARRVREVPIVEPRVVQTENGWEVVRD